MSKQKKLKAIKKETKSSFAFSLKIKNGKDLGKDLVFKSKADNFNEALEDVFNQSFGKVKTKCYLNLKKDGKQAELLYYPIQFKRACRGGGFNRELLRKRLETILK